MSLPYYAYTGKILRVNLGREEVKIESLDPEICKKYIGGRGIAAKILFDEIDPTVDPLSPDNKLLFATGPLTATGAPTCGRYMVVTKSPLTGTIACANSGGHFPSEMKFAGFDIFIFEGKAKEPVYIWINNQHIEIRSAKEIWAKRVRETEDFLLSRTDVDAKIASIGPAGERLVRIACIMNDRHRAAARGGVGAVMGSKNLKAVVVKGSHGVKVADKENFRKICLGILNKIQNSEMSMVLRARGTSMGIEFFNEIGTFPARNFKEIGFDNAHKIGGEILAKRYNVRIKACFSCTIGCDRVTRVKERQFAGHGEGPEYETIWAFGSQCGVDNLAAIIKANYLANDLGMDTISAGATIACAMELFERGIISAQEVGRTLNFGDDEGMVEMTEKMGLREGFGDIMAEGSYRMAERFGHPELAMCSKKQECAAYDPRGAQGMGLCYATSTRGASHTSGSSIGAEILGVPEHMDRKSTEGKGLLVKNIQDFTAVIDATGFCSFARFSNLTPSDICNLLKAATGFTDYHEGTIVQAGERIWNLEKLFNVKAGFTVSEDTLPERFFKEPVKAGPSQGLVNHLDKMLPEYYAARGWSQEGIPTEEKLKELDLLDVWRGDVGEEGIC